MCDQVGPLVQSKWEEWSGKWHLSWNQPVWNPVEGAGHVAIQVEIILGTGRRTRSLPRKNKSIFPHKDLHKYSQQLYLRLLTDKQPKWPSTGERMWYIHTREYYLAIKRNKLLKQVTTPAREWGKRLRGLYKKHIFLRQKNCLPKTWTGTLFVYELYGINTMIWSAMVLERSKELNLLTSPPGWFWYTVEWQLLASGPSTQRSAPPAPSISWEQGGTSSCPSTLGAGQPFPLCWCHPARVDMGRPVGGLLKPSLPKHLPQLFLNDRYD